MLKLLILFVVMVAVFSSPLSSSTPVDVRPEPPVADPVLPTEKEPIFQASSSTGAHSPGDLIMLDVY